jgi:hypothetical protein
MSRLLLLLFLGIPSNAITLEDGDALSAENSEIITYE